MGRITRTGAVVNFRYSIKVKKCGTRTSDGGLSSRLTHCPELVDRRTRQLTPLQREMWQVNWPQWLLSRRTADSAGNVAPTRDTLQSGRGIVFQAGFYFLLSHLLRRPPHIIKILNTLYQYTISYGILVYPYVIRRA